MGVGRRTLREWDVEGVDFPQLLLFYNLIATVKLALFYNKIKLLVHYSRTFQNISFYGRLLLKDSK